MAGLASYRKDQRAALMRGDDPGAVGVVDSGPPLLFPQMCPACGGPAETVVRIEKCFGFCLADDDGWGEARRFARFDVPFCRSCAARHRAEERRPGPWIPVLRVLRGDGSNWGGLIVCAVGAYFTWDAVKTLSLISLVFSALPWTIGGFLVLRTWRKNRYMAMSPPTSVTGAVDVTDLLSEAYEPAWRAFRFRDAEYARRFREANAGRLWNPVGTAARRALSKRKTSQHWRTWISGTIVGAAVLWWLWEEVIRPLWNWLAGAGPV